MRFSGKSTWICYSFASSGFLLLFLYYEHTQRSGPWLGEDSFDISEVFIVSSLLIGAFVAVLASIDLLSRSEAASEIHPGVILALGLLLALGSWAMPGFVEVPIRAKLTKCHGIMRAMAEKINESAIQSGELQTGIDSLFTESERVDPFAPGFSKIQWYKKSDQTGLLLSVGPNHRTDSDLPNEIILYSPTNGSFSMGDILQEVAIQTTSGREP